jgi:pSer/pThr/pTyr-binding forkhead associated (FHA) protein
MDVLLVICCLCYNGDNGRVSMETSFPPMAEERPQGNESSWIGGNAILLEEAAPTDQVEQDDHSECEDQSPQQPIARNGTVRNKNSISDPSDAPPSPNEDANQVQSPAQAQDAPAQEGQEAQGQQIVLQGSGENAFVKFQLIPVSITEGKSAVGEVVERKLKEGQVMKLGRQVIKDGQATIKGNKKATEIDCWFTSKVVSRLHAEIWTKDGQLCVKDVGSSSGTFLNGMRLSPTGKESRPYPLKQGDMIQFGVDFKGKADSILDSYR